MKAFSLCSIVFVSVGCSHRDASKQALPMVDDAGQTTITAASFAAPAPPPQARELSIPAGTFASGSTPGDEGRKAATEPLLVPVTLGAYSIDARPFPNDENAPPLLVDSEAEANELCVARGARLCSELEWEHACKGPKNEAFATGGTWEPACDKTPSQCQSGFGARAMGFMREWTEGGVRGGGDHRCANRSAKSRGHLAFRCCAGDRNSAEPTLPEAKPAFRKANVDLERIFAGVPELSRIQGGKPFTDVDMDVPDGVVLATAPILWSPEPGIELLVATGHLKKTNFVVALWPLPDGTYRYASSFLLLNESSPVVLAYEPARKKELRWTSCWGCAGEQGGIVLHDDDGRAVIVQY